MTKEQRAWMDWVRVEACIGFGVQRWMWAGLLSGIAYQYLMGISSWLALIVILAILIIRAKMAQRDDAKRLDQLLRDPSAPLKSVPEDLLRP